MPHGMLVSRALRGPVLRRVHGGHDPLSAGMPRWRWFGRRWWWWPLRLQWLYVLRQAECRRDMRWKLLAITSVLPISLHEEATRTLRSALR